MNDKAPELLPCPFCGGEAKIKTEHTVDCSNTHIYCVSCGLKTGAISWMGNDSSIVEEMLLKKWNLRIGLSV